MSHSRAMMGDSKPLKWDTAIKLICWVFSIEPAPFVFSVLSLLLFAVWSEGVDPWYCSLPSLFPMPRAGAETFPWCFSVAGALRSPCFAWLSVNCLAQPDSIHSFTFVCALCLCLSFGHTWVVIVFLSLLSVKMAMLQWNCQSFGRET